MTKTSLPLGWQEQLSKSYPGRVYYFNVLTGVSSWDHPKPTADANSTNKKILPENSSFSVKRITANNSQMQRNASEKMCNTTVTTNSIKATTGTNKVLKWTNEVFISRDAGCEKSIRSLTSKSSNTICKSMLESRTAVVVPVVQQTKTIPSRTKAASAIMHNLKTSGAKTDIVQTKNSSQISSLQTVSLKRSFDDIDKEVAVKSFKTDSISKTKLSRCKTKFKSEISGSEDPKNNLKTHLPETSWFEETSERNTSQEGKNDGATKRKKKFSPTNISDVEMLDVSSDLSTLDVFTDCNIMDVDDPESYYIVLDTNVFMRELKLIDELKDTPLEGCGPPHIVIPWIVIQELDALKSRHGKSGNKRAAAEAVRYLFFKLNSKHPRFHGQSPKQAAGCSKNYSECNDDKILECCMDLADSIPQNKVILLTNDRNLSNKAMICDIVVHTWDSLMKNLKADVRIEAVSHKKGILPTPVSTSRKLTFDGSNVAITLKQGCPKRTGPSMTIKALKRCRKKLKDLKEAQEYTKREVDKLICKAKVLLKGVLEPFYVMKMTEAYEDTWSVFAIQSPYVLTEIVESTLKYWDTVFSFTLPRNLKADFEVLCEKFQYSEGFICDEEEALGVLTSIESIFSEIQKGCTTIVVPVGRIEKLKNECEALCQEHSNISSTIGNNITHFVLPVFEHIWALINHLSGMIMDFCEIPHNFSYTKPVVLPSKAEFHLLIPNLYPSIHQIKRYMANIFESPSDDTFQHLYKCLVQFVPSLQIQAELPPLSDFSVEHLKAFCINSQTSETLRNGYKQLCNFHTKLNEALAVILHKKIS